MNILVLTRYSRQGASSRLRAFQFAPWLDDAGIKATFLPFFSDQYVQALQEGRREAWSVVSAYGSRVGHLLDSRRYDLVWVEKEVFPWLPAFWDRLFLSRKVPYIMDYDDAVFHYYDLHRHPTVRWLLGEKHARLIRDASLVMAGNDYLADYARKSGARQVELVPTVIDLERYPDVAALPDRIRGATPCIGWIGQRSTADLLVPYGDLFAQLASSGQARFSAVGIDAPALGLPMMTPLAWSEETEVASIQSFDIGIMPLIDAPFERGKCGYKLIQYMACGLPVVASPVGVNSQIVEHGVNGFLAKDQEQWAHALQTLLESPELRMKMGQAGRAKVEKYYCAQKIAPRIIDLLGRVART